MPPAYLGSVKEKITKTFIVTIKASAVKGGFPAFAPGLSLHVEKSNRNSRR